MDRVRIKESTLLSDDWHILRKTTYDFRRRDGSWQTQTRETYDRGNGAVILLYNNARQTVVLTRQFRFPTYGDGHDGFLIEAAAGLLDQASPEQRIRAEAEEETGYRLGRVDQVFEIFMSPGSVTERLHFFVAEYDASTRVGHGGGLAEEGEDIEVLEMGMDQALAFVASGEIADAKTIILLQYMQLHLRRRRSQMILVAGPYRSGTGDDPLRIAANLDAMQACALQLYQAGHLPMLGEWLAMPLLAQAGSRHTGDAVFNTLFHPAAERLLARCDAVLRIGGPSAGADAMVACAQRLGLIVYTDLYQVPQAHPA